MHQMPAYANIYLCISDNDHLRIKTNTINNNNNWSKRQPCVIYEQHVYDTHGELVIQKYQAVCFRWWIRRSAFKCYL